MSYSYDRYERQRRSTYGASTRRSAFGYWIPLAVTVTVATVGIAAWIWSERKDGDDDDDDYRRKEYESRGEGTAPPGYGGQGPGQTPYGPGQPPYGPGSQGQSVEDQSVIARMSGAIRRTPSPQQIFDGASRRVVAGVAAAGAAVGGALSSIREEDKKDFEDHSRWSEEAETRATEGSSRREPSAPRRNDSKRKTVAVVLSAESDYDHGAETSYHQEHAVSGTLLTTFVGWLIHGGSQYYPTYQNMLMTILVSLCSSMHQTSSNTLCRVRSQETKLQCQ